MNFWTFVEQNIKVDPSRLRLKYHNERGDLLIINPNVSSELRCDVELAITQIECRRRFGKKLAETLTEYPHWLFPTVLSGEQSTSDRLARYHASLVTPRSTVADLTCGLGIDALHISRRAAAVIACDIESAKTAALSYNVRQYSLTNISPATSDCRDFIESLTTRIDCAFIDPARRSDDGARVFALAQCQPDVTAMLPLLANKVNRLIVKMSPMLDITQTLRELPGTTSLVAIGTTTECKELLAVVDFRGGQTPMEDVRVSAITLFADGSVSEFGYDYGQGQIPASIGIPKVGEILYEPYPAVMKAAPFGLLTQRYDVKQIHSNTHLFYSREAIGDFPGKSLKIIEILPFSSKHIKRLKKAYPKISVATRNFPMSADKLRAKLGVADSNDYRLIAVTLADGNQAMIILSDEGE